MRTTNNIKIGHINLDAFTNILPPSEVQDLKLNVFQSFMSLLTLSVDGICRFDTFSLNKSTESHPVGCDESCHQSSSGLANERDAAIDVQVRAAARSAQELVQTLPISMKISYAETVVNTATRVASSNTKHFPLAISLYHCAVDMLQILLSLANTQQSLFDVTTHCASSNNSNQQQQSPIKKRRLMDDVSEDVDKPTFDTDNTNTAPERSTKIIEKLQNLLAVTYLSLAFTHNEMK